MSLFSRFKEAWNAFKYRMPNHLMRNGVSSSIRPDTSPVTFGRTSIINSIYNRIAIDGANIGLKHVQVNEEGRYLKDILDGINTCLTLSANKDQTGFDLIKDIIIQLLEEGNIAVLPIDVERGIEESATGPINSIKEIYSLRVGKIKEWFPDSVRVEAYDDRDGTKKELIFPKEEVAIIENPFYLAMNAQDSTASRLTNKLRLLDAIDNKNGSDRLDLIIQLPYGARTPSRQKLAETRLQDIEDQLTNSRLGIAYLEATEKITQLNRPVENHIQEQIEYLTNLLFSQLTMTQEIMNGTASASAMQNYYSRTIAPILKDIAYEMTRKWLSQNAITRGHKIWFYQNPFDLVPIEQVAEIVDKFTRNEIMTSNEIRQVLGMKPSSDPRADELRNKNLNASSEDVKVYDNKQNEGGNIDADT